MKKYKKEVLKLLEMDEYCGTIDLLTREAILERIKPTILAINLTQEQVHTLEFINTVDSVLQGLDDDYIYAVVDYIKNRDENIVTEITNYMLLKEFSFDGDIADLIFDFLNDDSLMNGK